MPLRPGSADDRSNRFEGGRTNAKPPLPLSSLPWRQGEAERGRNVAEKMSVPKMDVGAGLTRSISAKDGADSSMSQMPPPPPLSPRARIDKAAAVTEKCGGGGAFVDRIIAIAGAPGQLRAEALGLLARIGRSYPAHFLGDGGGLDSSSSSDERPQARVTTWKSASALLLRCFGDPDQNLRLHALKVLEALLLARAERAAMAAASASKMGAGNTTHQQPVRQLGSRVGVGKNPEEKVEERCYFSPETATTNGAKGGGDDANRPAEEAGHGDWGHGSGGGGRLWTDLVQKHLQRALEDPYHGVRAVACSCHGCLLDSDWEGFSDRERNRCLDRVLAATRDRAAGTMLTDVYF